MDSVQPLHTRTSFCDFCRYAWLWGKQGQSQEGPIRIYKPTRSVPPIRFQRTVRFPLLLMTVPTVQCRLGYSLAGTGVAAIGAAVARQVGFRQLSESLLPFLGMLGLFFVAYAEKSALCVIAVWERIFRDIGRGRWEEAANSLWQVVSVVRKGEVAKLEVKPEYKLDRRWHSGFMAGQRLGTFVLWMCAHRVETRSEDPDSIPLLRGAIRSIPLLRQREDELLEDVVTGRPINGTTLFSCNKGVKI